MRLTSYLIARILLHGGVVLVLALGWQILSIQQAHRAALERTADTMARILELQSTGLTENAALAPRFPEWYPLSKVEQPEGVCVRLLGADGRVLGRECRGHRTASAAVPAWFAAGYRSTFEPGTVLQRPIGGAGRGAVLALTPTAEVEIAAAWSGTRALAAPLVAIIGVLCVSAWWSVHRALRPAHSIIAGLAALERGELETRLGPFRWHEFKAIACACNSLAASLGESLAARNALSARLSRVQQDERYALARDLHDEFGQHLSAISAQAAALRLAPAIGAGHDALASIEHSARYLRGLVRGMLVRLRPRDREPLDLIEALRALARDCSSAAPDAPSVSVAGCGDLDDLSPDLAASLYRIVQEALTNARQHAAARTVAVTLRRISDELVVEIADDGRGCTPDTLEHGCGVRGIRERATARGGNAEFRTNSIGGLTVHARLPLSNVGRAA